MTMVLNRRHFLTATAATALPMHSVRWARAAASVEHTLIVVFLRGGLDALNFIAPADDAHYAASRPPALRVALTGNDAGLNIGGISGSGDLLLNPGAREIHQIWKNGRLAFVPASGLHHGTRSHFQAMDFIERGLNNDKNSAPRDGWLTRASLAMGNGEPGSIVCMGGALPQSLSLCENAMPVSDIWDIDWLPSTAFREALYELHASDSTLDLASRQAIKATGRLSLKLERNSDQQPKLRDVPSGINYPAGEFGGKLHFLAEMLRIAPDIGFATADLDGFDTHENQPDRLPQLLQNLSQGLSAFDRHLDKIGRSATVVVMSEFGRRVKANESRGTDHGHGGLMMVMGDAVNGGRNFGTWPGLATEQLDERTDLAVTTDYRDVLATVLRNDAAAKAAFPGHQSNIIDGLMRA
jgi:uncharacterized protein (DUF1501 family)